MSIIYPQNGCNVWYFNSTIINNDISTINTPQFIGFDQFGAYNNYSIIDTYQDMWIKYGTENMVYFNPTWYSDVSKTIVFQNKPTDNALSFMQANATEIGNYEEAWYINSLYTISNSFSININLMSNNTNFTAINFITGFDDILASTYKRIEYTDGTNTVKVDDTRMNGINGSFSNEYRIFFLSTAATGNLLTWLESNAIKLAISSKQKILINNNNKVITKNNKVLKTIQ